MSSRDNKGGSKPDILGQVHISPSLSSPSQTLPGAFPGGSPGKFPRLPPENEAASFTAPSMHNRPDVFIQDHSRLCGPDFAHIDDFALSKILDLKTSIHDSTQAISDSYRYNQDGRSTADFGPGDMVEPGTVAPRAVLRGARDDQSDIDPETRFSLFNTIDERTNHAPDISLLLGGASAASVFKDGDLTWWLDCTCPTDVELKVISKTFGIHPLTVEDILTQEKREKFEHFGKYYFVSFHTFEPDPECCDLLRPAHFYMVVFPRGILTFHKDGVTHPAIVRRRIRQLKKYFEVDPNWICYALIDDIIDSFEPYINRIEYEVDSIEDFVFVHCQYDSKVMFLHIAEAREKVMTLMSLISEKTRIVRDFFKYCLDELTYSKHARNIADRGYSEAGSRRSADSRRSENSAFPGDRNLIFKTQQIGADIAMYLGDIEDHIVTMSRNLKFYDEVLSRSSCNYLAQLQTHKRNLTNKLTLLMQVVTVLGTMFFPLQFATGLWSMNVNIPGQRGGPTGHPFNWFFGIMGLCLFLLIATFTIAKLLFRRGLNKMNTGHGSTLNKRSFKFNKSRGHAKSLLSYRTSD